MSKIFLLVIVAIFSLNAQSDENSSRVDSRFKTQLDPVYLLDVNRYPKFGAEIVLKNGKTIPFVSVKAMMNFYYHPEKYPGYGVSRDGHQIDKLVVKDYLDGTKIDAEKAYFVFGSRLSGPHGDDLIPLSSRAKAELFKQRFGGTRIMSYQEMRAKGFGLIKYLDM